MRYQQILLIPFFLRVSVAETVVHPVGGATYHDHVELKKDKKINALTLYKDNDGHRYVKLIPSDNNSDGITKEATPTDIAATIEHGIFKALRKPSENNPAKREIRN